MNILLMIADDWSPIAGCYGDSVVRTPNIDRLAERSMIFRQAFCTTPSCAASRANLLTGMYSHQHLQFGHCHGAHHFRTREDATTLPAILAKAGISSGLAGKSHIAPKETYPFTVWDEPTTPSMPIFSNKTVTDAAERCLEQFGDKSFYLQVATGYPHRAPDLFDLSVHAEEFADKEQYYEPSEVPVPKYLPDTPTVRKDLAEYYTYISRFDDFVGMTLDKLEQSGRAEDTLIVLTSDHGMPFPGAKASPFEAGHLCPLMIAHPDGHGAGKHCDALVNWTDLMPTILDILRVSKSLWPDGLTGHSFKHLLENPDGDWSDVTYYSHAFHEVTNYFPYRCIRGQRYKYLRCLTPAPLPLGMDLFDSPSYKSICETGGSPERTHERLLQHWPEAFFDLEEDPYETTNLIDSPEHQKLISEYRDRLTELRHNTEDPWIEIDYQEGRIPLYR